MRDGPFSEFSIFRRGKCSFYMLVLELTARSVSQILHKQCTFSYMPYFDECCKLLATDAEYASDQHLLHIVQLQRLSEKINSISAQNILGTHGPGSSSERSFREMKLELEQYRASLPCPLHENSK